MATRMDRSHHECFWGLAGGFEFYSQGVIDVEYYGLRGSFGGLPEQGWRTQKEEKSKCLGRLVHSALLTHIHPSSWYPMETHEAASEPEQNANTHVCTIIILHVHVCHMYITLQHYHPFLTR